MNELPAGYRDRGTGLVVFGSVEIVLGCMSALFIPLLILGRSISAATGTPPQPWGQILNAIAMYAFAAAVLVWLGIGSIRRRRSARALSLILGWSGLILGIPVLAMVALMLPSMARELPDGALAIAFIVLSFMAFPFVVVPAALVLFYRSRHVRATCEASDPRPGWTDACPLPVLAAVLWMAFGTSMFVLTALAGQAVLPVFGTAVVGLPAAIATFPVAAVWLYLARQLFRLQPSGWWGTVAFLLLGGVSGMITFVQTDLMELYRRLGYPDEQIERIRRIPLVTGSNLAMYLGVLIVAALGYLFWIRRHFVRPADPTMAPSTS